MASLTTLTVILAMSLTKTKSRVCSPSPKISICLPALALAKAVKLVVAFCFDLLKQAPKKITFEKLVKFISVNPMY